MQGDGWLEQGLVIFGLTALVGILLYVSLKVTPDDEDETYGEGTNRRVLYPSPAYQDAWPQEVHLAH